MNEWCNKAAGLWTVELLGVAAGRRLHEASWPQCGDRISRGVASDAETCLAATAPGTRFTRRRCFPSSTDVTWNTECVRLYSCITML